MCLSPGHCSFTLIIATHRSRFNHHLRENADVQLTVTVHSVERGVEAEVTRAVLTPVRVQVAGETLGGRGAAADRDSDEQTRSDSRTCIGAHVSKMFHLCLGCCFAIEIEKC